MIVVQLFSAAAGIYHNATRIAISGDFTTDKCEILFSTNCKTVNDLQEYLTR